MKDLDGLARSIAEAFRTLLTFLLWLFLGALYIVLRALPWAFRAGSVLVWGLGALWCMRTIVNLYEPAPGWAEYALLIFPVSIFALGGSLSWRIERFRWGILLGTGGVLYTAAFALQSLHQTYPLLTALLPAALLFVLYPILMARVRIFTKPFHSGGEQP